VAARTPAPSRAAADQACRSSIEIWRSCSRTAATARAATTSCASSPTVGTARPAVRGVVVRGVVVRGVVVRGVVVRGVVVRGVVVRGVGGPPRYDGAGVRGQARPQRRQGQVLAQPAPVEPPSPGLTLVHWVGHGVADHGGAPGAGPPAGSHDDTLPGGQRHLRHADAVLSTYRPDSDLLGAADADPDLTAVLSRCAEATTRTEGRFDPMVPGPSGPVLDPTGLVKGCAVGRAGALLSRLSELDQYVSVAGDISLAVQRPDPRRGGSGSQRRRAAPSWSPSPSRTRGVATFGTGTRWVRRSRTQPGRPATELASVTVAGPGLLRAGVHATAATARGLDALRWLPTLAGHKWFVVATDGRRWRSPG
jgi:thiamine biosynthesis lipoprotein